MATVVLNAVTKIQVFPAGTVSGLMRFTLSPNTGVAAVQEVDGVTATFTSVAAGDYMASAQRLDSAGSPLGDSVSVAFTIPESGVNVNVPDTLTVEIGA